MVEDVLVGDLGFEGCALVRHVGFDPVEGAFAGDVEVEAFAVAGCSGVDSLARGRVVGEHKGAIDGESLCGRHGEGEAVIEPDVAVKVANFVVVEGDFAAAVVAGGDEDAGLVVGWSAPYG